MSDETAVASPTPGGNEGPVSALEVAISSPLTPSSPEEKHDIINPLITSTPEAAANNPALSESTPPLSVESDSPTGEPIPPAAPSFDALSANPTPIASQTPTETPTPMPTSGLPATLGEGAVHDAAGTMSTGTSVVEQPTTGWKKWLVWIPGVK